jgi:hypothetical protein
MRNYLKGELDPDSLTGFATITEYVVIDVLGDAKKEKFGAPYDLVSESLGRVNVKYSVLHKGYRKSYVTRKCTNYHYWLFSKGKYAFIPDYYICLGMDKYQTEIIRVWIVPGNSEEVSVRGISLNINNEDRLKRYRVDPTQYNTTFQNMDITTKPEFRNTTKPKVPDSRYKWKEIYEEWE